MKGDTLRTSTVETVTKPNLNEALFVARDLPSDHPDVLAGRRFRSANRWPSVLPGFRDVIVDYCDTMERLVQKMVRLYARALDLPAEYFDQPFKEPQYKLRMTHYPYQAGTPDDEFGIVPHYGLVSEPDLQCVRHRDQGCRRMTLPLTTRLGASGRSPTNKLSIVKQRVRVHGRRL